MKFDWKKSSRKPPRKKSGNSFREFLWVTARFMEMVSGIWQKGLIYQFFRKNKKNHKSVFDWILRGFFSGNFIKSLHKNFFRVSWPWFDLAQWAFLFALDAHIEFILLWYHILRKRNYEKIILKEKILNRNFKPKFSRIWKNFRIKNNRET